MMSKLVTLVSTNLICHLVNLQSGAPHSRSLVMTINLLKQRFQISLMNLHQNWLKCLGLKARGGIIDIPHLQWAARGSSPKWLLSHGLLLLCPSFLVLPPKSVAFWSRRSPSQQSGLAVPLSLTLSLRYKPQPQISQGWLNSEV